MYENFPQLSNNSSFEEKPRIIWNSGTKNVALYSLSRGSIFIIKFRDNLKTCDSIKITVNCQQGVDGC